MTAFLEEWDVTVTDKLDQFIFEVMACLTVKIVQIREIYPYFSYVTRWKTKHPL